MDSGRPFYGLHADAFDLLITDPVEPWVDAVHSRLEPAHGPRSSVLDAGCGTGRHAAALIAKGHRVDLADASPPLLAQASRRCPSSRALLVDLCAMDLAPEYDAVTCRGVLNDMITDEERESAIASLTRCLRPDGLLFLDVREHEASRLRADGGRRCVVADLGDGRELRFSTRTSWRQGLTAVEERTKSSWPAESRGNPGTTSPCSRGPGPSCPPRSSGTACVTSTSPMASAAAPQTGCS